jgi:UDPglucose 6-dehydrogenase
MKIGIVGNGFVGKATQLIKCSIIESIYVYDIIPEKCIPQNLSFEQLSECDIIFIALPTPMRSDGSCYIDMIKDCVTKLKKIINSELTSIVLRSTVPPGTTDELDIYIMPEFLTERNWQSDFINCKNWIFGCDLNDTKFIDKINNLFKCARLENILVSDNVYFTTRKEAEFVKYIRNTFLALKISFFNEINEFSNKSNINFENVRYLSTLDERIGSSHSYVPGTDGIKGFGGTCLPKDSHILLHEFTKINMESYIIKSMITRNEIIDRPQKDWLYDNGRVII